MPLILIELAPTTPDRTVIQKVLDAIGRAVGDAGGAVVEAQVSAARDRVYVVADHPDLEALGRVLADSRLSLPPVDVAEVRLVGATVEDVRKRSNGAGYLVEWDLPNELTMDRYLERKRANSPRYAHVPEVRFLRTYVREDMQKCLCLYDAPDEECVRRAREAVNAPITRLTRIEGAP